MDAVDVAEESESVILAKQVAALRSRKKIRELSPKGACHYCDEPFEVGDKRVFCDTDCRDDNQKYNKKQ